MLVFRRACCVPGSPRTVWAVLEFVSGGELTHYITTTDTPWDESLAIRCTYQVHAFTPTLTPTLTSPRGWGTAPSDAHAVVEGMDAPPPTPPHHLFTVHAEASVEHAQAHLCKHQMYTRRCTCTCEARTCTDLPRGVA